MPESCLITRGGDIELIGEAVAASPQAMSHLAADLLEVCADPGDLGRAVAAERLTPFLETLGQETTWKRRRVQIASVALRALATEADRELAAHWPDPPSEVVSAPVDTVRDALDAASHDELTRRYTRQSPRGPRQDTSGSPRAGGYRLKVKLPASRTRGIGVSPRVAIWMAIAVSATAAGLGAWRASAQPRPPVVVDRPVQSRVQTAPPAPSAEWIADPGIVRTSSETRPTPRSNTHRGRTSPASTVRGGSSKATR